MQLQNDHDILIAMRSEMKTRLDSIEIEIKDLKDNTKGQIMDHETRLRDLEANKWKIIGIATTLSLIAGIAATYFAGK